MFIKKAPLKMGRLYGEEGKALIVNDQTGLRNDNVYPELKVITGAEFVEKFGPTRKGWDQALVSDGVLVNMVGKNYGVVPNIDFFGQVENQLLNKDIKTLVRSINRDNSAFAVDHILADDRYTVRVKGSKKDDIIRPMISFTNSYDSSTKTTGKFGFYREHCKNGLHVLTSEIGFSLRHKGKIMEVVLPEIQLLLEKFINNEYYEIHKKFVVLAETPIKNIEEYVKIACHDLGIFKFEKSDENPEASKNAEMVIQMIKREASVLGEQPSLWLGYNSLNFHIHNVSKRSIGAQYDLDAKIFNYNMELAGVN